MLFLELDKENRRLSLGHKQLEENPWDVYETVFRLILFTKEQLLRLKIKLESFLLPWC